MLILSSRPARFFGVLALRRSVAAITVLAIIARVLYVCMYDSVGIAPGDWRAVPRAIVSMNWQRGYPRLERFCDTYCPPFSMRLSQGFVAYNPLWGVECRALFETNRITLPNGDIDPQFVEGVRNHDSARYVIVSATEPIAWPGGERGGGIVAINGEEVAIVSDYSIPGASIVYTIGCGNGRGIVEILVR